MQRRALLHSVTSRMQPSRWGALALCLLLLVFVRSLLGDPPSPQDWAHLLRGFLLLFGLVVLAPVPWQWTRDARRKAPFLRGLLQALLWNPIWMALLFHWAFPRSLRTPPSHDTATLSFLRHLHQRSGLPGYALPLVGLLPAALLLGWFIAALQAAEGDKAEAVAKQKTLEATARQAQEQALKAQLDPHVLYNALSGISELIREDAERAEEAVVHLGELYRKLTAFGARESVSVDEERALVADYLAVEQIRLGPRLRVRWEWPEALGSRPVPPLLLQPLVENALKHGLAPHKGGGELRIAVEPEGEGLRFIVANEGPPPDPQWQAGTGLSNLASRLALLGGGSGLSLSHAEGWTRAELTFHPGGAP